MASGLGTHHFLPRVGAAGNDGFGDGPVGCCCSPHQKYHEQKFKDKYKYFCIRYKLYAYVLRIVFVMDLQIL